jgi:hypothetical protein
MNLTLEQIIELLDYKASPIHPTNISGMERGEREPPLPLLLAYARLVGISTDVLIDDELDLPKALTGKGERKEFKITKGRSSRKRNS